MGAWRSRLLEAGTPLLKLAALVVEEVSIADESAC